MDTEVKTTDNKARVMLAKKWASSTIIIEYISETEIRIRKARVVPEDEFQDQAKDTRKEA